MLDNSLVHQYKARSVILYWTHRASFLGVPATGAARQRVWGMVIDRLGWFG